MIYKIQVQFFKEYLEIKEDQIYIGIKSNPVKGQANKEIIKIIAKHFGVSSTMVQIKSGHRSREKVVEILQ